MVVDQVKGTCKRPERRVLDATRRARGSRSLCSLPPPPPLASCARSYHSRMATESLRIQTSAKWQKAFERLNGEEPGIQGLLSFSQVCEQFLPLTCNSTRLAVMHIGMADSFRIPISTGYKRPHFRQNDWCVGNETPLKCGVLSLATRYATDSDGL